jgi:hypothetical protein
MRNADSYEAPQRSTVGVTASQGGVSCNVEVGSMRRARARALAGAVVAVALSCAAGRAGAQCTKDIECKGDRICNEGRCVDPSPAPAVVVPAAGEAAPGAAPAVADRPPPATTEAVAMEPRSPAMRTTGVVLTLAGGASLVAAVVLAIDAASERHKLDASCVNNVCPPSQASLVSESNALATASTVTAIGAIALLGAGIPLYFVGRHEVPAARRSAWWIPRELSTDLRRVTVTFGF